MKTFTKNVINHVGFFKPLLVLIMSLISFASFGQIGVTVTGATNTTPNLAASYLNFTAAVTALNGVTAMTGPVTLTLAAGTSETAPVKGFNISTSTAGLLNATNTLTIVKAVGAATVINAAVGTAATAGVANPDGMLYLSGSDYVTIDGLTFTDGNSGSATVAMEFGIALFKRAAGDGCNNNTIQNCIFNMQRINNSASGGPMGEGANAIEIVNSTAAAAATALTPTNGGTLATNGTNSNNRIYSNTINGGNAGIHLGGYLAPSGQGPTPNPATFLGDIGNDIGGTVIGTGNSILNFGGGAAVQPAVGIRANLQWSVNIRYNTIDNNNGSGVNHAITLRGIYAQAGISANATISNNTVTVRSGATTSALTAIENAIGSTAAANTVNINDNTIRFSYTTATSGAFSAITNSSTAATVNINNNNIQQLPATNYPSTGTITVIAGGSPGGPMNVTGNTVSNFNMTGASGTLRAITASTPTGLYTVTGNTIENLSYATVGSSGSITGIYNLASATLQNINTNIIRNFSTPTAGTLNGIQNNTVAGTFQCKNNQIYNFSTSAGGAGGFSANGITWSNANCDLSNNIIYAINSTGSTGGTGGTINGITHSGASTVNGNAVYNLSSNSTNVVIVGIAVAATGTNTVTNNLVGDLRAPNSTGNISISGMLISGGTTNNIYHNTVNIASTTTSATTFGTSAIYFSSATPVNNLRNNVFVNTSSPGPTGGFTTAIRYTTAPTSTNFPSTNNNNFYYGGVAAANRVIYCENSTATPANGQQTIANYKNYISITLPVAGREGSSVSEIPNWVSTTGSNPITNFLKYNTGAATQIEQGGVTGTGVGFDYTGTTVRCPTGGCPGGASTPDMGAWEQNGLSADLSAPSISYTQIPNTGCTSNITLSATITDASGVNGTAGAGRPRLYYKKSTDANTYAGNTSGDDGWKYVEATNGSSPFSFTTNYSLLQSAVANGDVIEYFVVAQDNAAPNVGINSGTFAATPASVALTSAAFPISTTINSFTILNALATTINIPADYTTLTGAAGLFNAINTGSLVGNTVVNINANVTTETGAIALNQIAYGCAGPYTLTIKPTGAPRTVSGANAGATLIRLNGADNVIIDGSTSGGTDRSLTITNTGTTSSTTTIGLISLGVVAGATDNTIKNCNISTGSQGVVSTYGINVGTTAGTAGSDNDNTTIQNNNITVVTTGIYAAGTAAVSAGGLDNLAITGNNIVINGTAGTNYGIRVAGGLGSMVDQNNIDVQSSATGQPVGISVETNFVSSTVTRNNIQRVLANTTGGYGGRGITVGTGTASSALTISNNMIAGVNGDNWSAFGNASSAGIWIGVIGNSGTLTTTAGGINLYYNSIHMAGTYTRASTVVLTAAMYVGSGATALDVRNNIFSNSLQNISGTAGACRNYAIYSVAAPAAFTTLNNNDYYGVSTTNNTFFTGFISAAVQSTLANWQTATGKEAAGQNVDPQFQANNDLHIQPSSTNVNGLAATGTGVTVDYDNEARAGSPDIGADEYTPCSPPSVSITPSGTTVCNPNPNVVTLTAVGTGTKVWYVGTPGIYTGIYTNAGATIAYTGTDLGTVYVKSAATYTLRLDFGGCYATATQTITSVPGVTISSTTSVSPICPGTTSQLNVNASIPGGVLASAYTFNATLGTYTPISGGTVSHASGWDDTQVNAAPIGFTFNFRGTNYTTVNINPNGYITFGATNVASYTPISNTTVFDGSASAFGRDNQAQNTAPLGEIQYLSSGGVFTVQWSNARRYNTTTLNAERFEYQIQLIQATGEIKFVYGNWSNAVSATTSNLAQVGLRGATNADFNNLDVAAGGNWSSPTPGGTNTATCYYNEGNVATKPANGLTYTFTPPSGGLTYSWSAVSLPANIADLDDPSIKNPIAGPLANPSFPGSDIYPYQVLVTNTGNGCTANPTVSVTVIQTTVVVNAPLVSDAGPICQGTNVTLTGTNRFSGGCSPYTYYWYAGATQIGTGTVATPAGANTLVVAPTTTTNYTLRIVDNDGQDVTGAAVTVTVNNPQPLTAVAATRCGIGTTQLTGTVNGGDVLSWYTASTGGTYLGSGSPLTSPSISSTTTFYAAAATGATPVSLGPVSPAAQGGTIGTQTIQWNINFTTLVPTAIQSVTVFPVTAGNPGVIELRAGSSSSGTLLGTVNYTSTVSGGATPQVVILNFIIATPGSYNLYTPTIPAGGFSRNTSGQTYPVSSAVANITGNGFDNTYWMGLYDWKFITGCEGTRVPVVATVNPPPALTVTADQTVCNNVAATLSVVTGGASYNTYIWSPTTNLFTDAGCTIPYTGTSLTTVYAKSATASATTYTLTGTQTSGSFCVNEATTTLTIQPTAAVSPVSGSVCYSGALTFGLVPATGYAAGSIEWQTSTTSAVAGFSTIGGETNPSYTTPVIVAGPVWYKVILKNSLSATCQSFTVPVSYNAPAVISSSGATRCGTGTVTLSATGSAGSTMNWYLTPSGGVPQVSAPTYNPIVSATTTFYVAASAGGGGTTNTGKTNANVTSTSGAGTTNFGLVFDALTPFILKSVKVYPVSATSSSGTLTIDIINSAGVVLNTYTTAVSGSPAASLTPQTINVNFSVAAGTNLKMRPAFSGITGLLFEPSASAPSGNYGFPYVVPGVLSINHGTLTAAPTNTPRTDLYYYFYDWVLTTDCESPRTAVVATVDPAPAISVSATPLEICEGGYSILDVTSGNAGYTYSWAPGALTGAAQSVSPAATTLYTVTATDLTAGPFAGCANTAQIQVVVNPNPVAPIVNVTPAGAVCGGTIKTLAASATTAATYNFGSTTTATTTTGYPSPYSRYYIAQRMQMLIRRSELAGAGFLAGSSLTTIAFNVASKGAEYDLDPVNGNVGSVNFQMSIGHAGTTDGTLSSFQSGLTQVVAPANYVASIGSNIHTFSSPFIWDGTSDVIIETTHGGGPYIGATADGVGGYYTNTSFLSTIVARADNTTSVVATSMTTPLATLTPATIRPDFVITGFIAGTTIKWSPVANLFTDAAATIPYIANSDAPTVYSKMNATTPVTTTFVLPVTGCSSSTLSTLLYTPRPAVDISANSFVCQGQDAPVNFYFSGTGPWTMNYEVNGVAQAPLVGNMTSPLDIPYTNATGNRFYEVTSLTDAVCTADASDLDTLTMHVPIPCTIVWNGSQSNVWTDALNWTPSNSAPSPFTSIIIPGTNVPNQPAITGVANCANINLFNSPIPSIDAGGQLNINGDVNGSVGASIGGLGKVRFSGTGLQTISGRAYFSNVDFANTSAQGVVVQSGATLGIEPVASSGSGLVKFLPNARLTNNGTFVLGSNALGTAKIGVVPVPTFITGNITQERYIPFGPGSGGWFFVGSPFTGRNFTNYSDDFRVVGLDPLGFGNQGGGILPSPEPERSTIFKFDEPVHNTWTDTVQKIGWRIPLAADNVVPGTGYRAYINYQSATKHKFDNDGAMVSGDFNFPTMTRNEYASCVPATYPCNETAGRGWNLVANPYPCDIDWDAAPANFTKPAQLSNAWWRWHSEAGAYGVYPFGGPYAGTSPIPTNPNLIPSGQAFFARLAIGGNYSATMSIKEAAKSEGSSGQFLRTNVVQNIVRINMTKPGQPFGYDAVVRFMEGATDGYDLAYDFSSLGGSSFHISVPVVGEDMSIASYAPLTEMKLIPLTTKYQGVYGTFKLKFTEMQNLLSVGTVYLRDNLLGTLEQVTEGYVYSYFVSSADGLIVNRFELVFNPNAVTSVKESKPGASMNIIPNPSESKGGVTIALVGFEGVSANIQVVDALGRVVVAKTASLISEGITEYQLNENLAAGMYTVKVIGTTRTLNQKMIVK